jgi:hypothetical protein
MRSSLPLVLCLASVFASPAFGQSSSLQPIHESAGTVLSFYSQTRLSHDSGDALDTLPRGTVLKVKLLDSIDSTVDRDGLEFHGTLVAPLTSGNEVIVHADAEVRGLLVLLRSRNHPDGFRYELLITSITENGKSYEFTAALNPSFFEPSAPPQPTARPSVAEPAKVVAAKPAEATN